MDYFRLEGTDMYLRGINAPDRFWEQDSDTQTKVIKSNMRSILQLFDIRAIVYPDHVEIKGVIPTQMLDWGDSLESDTGVVLPSPSPT